MLDLREISLAFVGLTCLAGCAQRPTPTGPATEAATPLPSPTPATSSVAPLLSSAAAEDVKRLSPRPAPEAAPSAVILPPSSLAAARPAAAVRAAGDWAQFRGPGGLGVSSESVPTTWSASSGVRWKTPLPGPGTSSPILSGNRIFLTCYTGYGVPGQPGGSPDQVKRHLVCLDRETGKLLWNTEVPGQGAEEASIREGHGYASSTPAADADRVYALFGRSGVFAFDHGGRQLWRADVGERTSGWGSAASPVLHGNLVIVNASVESESLVALDRRTGKEVWRAGGIKESWNTPLLVALPGGKTELVLAIFRGVLGFDPVTGQKLWSCDTEIDWYMVPSLVARDGIVYCIGGRSGGALAVRAGGRGDVTGSHRLWTARQGSNVSSPVLHGDHLYWAKDSPAILYCAEASTGRIVYEERVDAAGQIYASALLADGKIYYVSRGGRTFVVPAAPKHELLAVNQVEERGTFNSSPAVGGGRLYLRSDRFLYCIGQ